MKFEFFMPCELRIVHSDYVVETACGNNVLELRVPLQAEDTLVRTLQSLLIFLSLSIVDDYATIKEANGENMLLFRVPGKAAA